MLSNTRSVIQLVPEAICTIQTNVQVYSPAELAEMTSQVNEFIISRADTKSLLRLGAPVLPEKKTESSGCVSIIAPQSDFTKQILADRDDFVR
jgi:hypothetical protein